MTRPRRAVAAAVGVAADRVLGEPPPSLHPVAWFGTLMTAAEQRGWADRRSHGVAHLLAGAAVATGAGAALERLLGPTGATAAATEIATSGRMLGATATTIAVTLAAGDLGGARRLLPSLVGRDPSGLDAEDIGRAVIESVAENTVDAVVAPLFWATVGGAPVVLAHRAVNTLDAMVGHRTPRYQRFGWASARADDLAAWLPARLTAILVATVRPRRARAIVRAVAADAPHHPSPNGGVAEAAYAAALDLRLGGTNRYGDRVEHRGVLHPAGRAPEPADIARAVTLLRDVTVAAVTGTVAVAAVTAARTGRDQHRDRRGARTGRYGDDHGR